MVLSVDATIYKLRERVSPSLAHVLSWVVGMELGGLLFSPGQKSWTKAAVGSAAESKLFCISEGSPQWIPK